MTYELILTPEAQRHLKEWARSGQKKVMAKSRMIYSIEDDKVIVTVISLKGHYNDK